ncbi:MAG: ImmA/IrrE family metallo-endopeptidase [Nitrospirae bacterium]|nr:ImmA/IrrE family metallo-endopeptidase [Nitrospirota bacterium]
MARSIPALVNSSLLTWAREDAGFSIEQAAERADFSTEKLQAWESGLFQPTLRQAEKLAKLYHRPYSVFCLSEPPKTKPLASEYRRLPGVRPGAESPELRFAIRQMIYRRKVALGLISELADKPDKFLLSAHLQEDTEHVATHIRSKLGISIETQHAWPNEFRAWHGWRAAVEDIGVLVFQFSKVNPKEVRGVSLLDFPLPVIGINSKEVPASKPFSLLHELVHIMLAHADEEKPALLEKRNDQDWLKVERFAEAVAGAVLMPSAALLKEPEIANRTSGNYWNIPEVRKLARRYKVTPKAMITRLLWISKCTPAGYRKWIDDWEDYLKAHPPKPGGGIATPAEKALNRNGRSFTQLVLNALSLERITSVEASHYLELNFPHIETLRRNVAMARQFEPVMDGVD